MRLFTDWPSLRILWLLTQCTVVGLVLLVGCILIFRKRAGIVVLHSGVGLMMFSELLVGVAAVEGQMQIVEGQTVNFVMDTREIELAVVDPSDPREDEGRGHSAVPAASGKVVQDEALPFDVELVEYQTNSVRRTGHRLRTRISATAGIGLVEMAVPADIGERDRHVGRIESLGSLCSPAEEGHDEALGVYLVGLEDSFVGVSENGASGWTRPTTLACATSTCTSRTRCTWST